MSDLFISYAWEDRVFAGRLAEAIAGRGKDVWIDLENTSPTAGPMSELQRAIEAADAFVFVLSPESLDSSLCIAQLDRAEELGKPIVPVLWRLPAAELPAAVSTRTWELFAGAKDFDAAVDGLVAALESESAPEASAEAAEEPQEPEPQTPPATAPVSQGPDPETPPEAAGETERPDPGTAPESVEETTAPPGRVATARRSIALVAGTCLAVIMAAVVFAVIGSDATSDNGQDDPAHDLLAAASRQLETDPELSLSLAAEATRVAPSESSESALREALIESRIRLRLPADARVVAYSPDGSLAAAGGPRRVEIFDALTGRPKSSVRIAGGVSAVSFSPSGELALAAGFDGALTLFKPRKGTVTTEIDAHRAGRSAERVPINTAEFVGGGGARLLSAGDDGAVRLWSASGKPIAELDLGGRAYADVAAAGERLVAGGNRAAGVWAIGRAQLERSARLDPPPPKITGVAFAGGSDRVFVNGTDSRLRLYRASTGNRLRSLASVADGTAAFSPNGRSIAIPGQPGRLWGIGDGGPLAVFDSPVPLVAMAFDPGGELVASVAGAGEKGERAVRLWEAKSGEQAAALMPSAAGDVAFSPAGQTILTAEPSGAAIWSLAPGYPKFNLGPVANAGFSAEGNHAIGFGSGPTARVWSAEDGLEQRTLRAGGRLVDASLSAGGGRALTQTALRARVWDVARGKPMLTARTAVAELSPSGALLAAARGPDVRLLDVRRRDRTRTLAGEGPRIEAIAFDAAGTRLIATDLAGTVSVWDLATGESLASYAGAGGGAAATPAISADGSALAIPGADGVRVLEADGGAERIAVEVDGVAAIELSDDGSRLLVTTDAGTAQVFDTESGEPPIELGSSAPVTNADLSGDGRFAVTSGRDARPVTVWDAATGADLFSLPGRTATISGDGQRILVTGERGAIFSCEACVPLERLERLAKSRITRELTANERSRYLAEDPGGAE